ncbi:ferritin-like domain-containing protein [Microtetraspora malaysiensis]|uniref:ferritin-like domain-containing protein n=1 Tax=Microtetraspora malaysiensis TaxID=161358 RepID=UPI000835ED02|nr:ferritin-like domain-containing protein [Microtetraspora malaysiensis]
MSTHELYTIPAELSTWDVEMAGSARFTWEYDDGRDRMLSLYQKGKDKQWDSVKRIDWDIEVDPYNVLGVPDNTIAIYGTPLWERMGEKQRQEVRLHGAAWQFSQFLHGEQGAMICSARIVESVPDLDSKFYAATQTMDEARHAETYARFLKEKVGLAYPINEHLKALLDSTLSDSRWDMPYLGMQVLIEGLALAAFGVMRDITTKPLPKQILAYVMQDEARHVAFGRMALRDYYKNLSETERREREDFVIEGCYLMRDRLRGRETWEALDLSKQEVDEAMGHVDESDYMRLFRSLLFSRIVPCVKDIGLWSPRLQQAYADMGVLEMAGQNLEALMKQDEEIADKIDAERFTREEAERHEEVTETIAMAAD